LTLEVALVIEATKILKRFSPPLFVAGAAP
jgi:hypothetical protein